MAMLLDLVCVGSASQPDGGAEFAQAAPQSQRGCLGNSTVVKAALNSKPRSKTNILAWLQWSRQIGLRITLGQYLLCKLRSLLGKWREETLGEKSPAKNFSFRVKLESQW